MNIFEYVRRMFTREPAEVSVPDDLRILASKMKEHAQSLFAEGRRPTAHDMDCHKDRIAIQCERRAVDWHVSISSMLGDDPPPQRDIDLIWMAFFPAAKRENVAMKQGERNKGVIHLYYAEPDFVKNAVLPSRDNDSRGDVCLSMAPPRSSGPFG